MIGSGKIAAAIATCLLIAPVATADIVSVPDAIAAMDRGDMILLDIRSKEEWKETGLPEGALAVSLHSPDFGQKLSEVLARKGARQVGLICATGGRTAHVLKVLDANGIGGVVDVSEGMLGNANGPGWIARGLPISTPAMAQEALSEFLSME